MYFLFGYAIDGNKWIGLEFFIARPPSFQRPHSVTDNINAAVI